MEDADSAELKEKLYFRFWRFLFFELWSFWYIFVLESPQFSMNFHDNSKNRNLKFSPTPGAAGPRGGCQQGSQGGGKAAARGNGEQRQGTGEKGQK